MPGSSLQLLQLHRCSKNDRQKHQDEAVATARTLAERAVAAKELLAVADRAGAEFSAAANPMESFTAALEKASTRAEGYLTPLQDPAAAHPAPTGSPAGEPAASKRVCCFTIPLRKPTPEDDPPAAALPDSPPVLDAATAALRDAKDHFTAESVPQNNDGGAPLVKDPLLKVRL